MKSSCKSFLVLALLIAFASWNSYGQEAGEGRERELELAIGIDELIRLDYNFDTRFLIGDESKVKLIATPSKRELTFRGVKPGRTSVTVRDAAGEIRDKFIVNVTSDGQSNVVRELRDLLGDIEGIEITIKGGKVVLEGAIVVPGDIGRIATVLNAYPDVLPLVEMSNQTQRIIARRMQEEINRNNMKDVTVRVVNSDYWLEGTVNSEAKRVLAEQIARAYVPGTVQSLARAQGGERFQETPRGEFVNFISVNERKDPEPPPKLIKVTAQFVELSKDYQKIFAFQWNPLMNQAGSISFGRTDQEGNSTGGITTSESGTLSGTISNLFPKLNSAKSAGYARVIQSGMVVTQEDQEASVTKNRSIPIQVGSGEFAQAASTNIRFVMRVTPSIADEENIMLRGLNIDVSLPAGQSGGQPTATSNVISTNLVVKSKESAVIGGIVQSTSNTSYDKDRPQGAVTGVEDDQEGASVLFNLLRSKGYNTSKSQFVIFVTPELISSASEGTEEVRRKFRKRQR